MSRLGTAAALVLALTAVCDQPDVHQPPAQQPGDATPGPTRVYRTVTIGDNFFNPIPLTVTVGTRVFWVHKGLDQHTVSFDPPISFFSGLMNRTDQVQRQFNNPGYYTYHCDVHEGMRGVIAVKAPE